MIILASASPRRKELLKNYNIPFISIPSNIIEEIDYSLTPDLIVQKLAYQKAVDIYNKNVNDVIIGADTVVVIGNKILGKPADELEAFSMLKKLSGNVHQVMTGVCIINGNDVRQFTTISNVEFKKIEDTEILEYIATKEPMDKAGSYAIQGIGRKFVESYEGDFNNIVGLPIFDVVDTLKEMKIID